MISIMGQHVHTYSFKAFHVKQPSAFASMMLACCLSLLCLLGIGFTGVLAAEKKSESRANDPDYIQSLYSGEREKGLFDFYEIRYKNMSGFKKWVAVLRRSKMADEEVIKAAKIRKGLQKGAAKIRIPRNYDPNRMRKLEEAQAKAKKEGKPIPQELPGLCPRFNGVECRKNKWNAFIKEQQAAKKNGTPDRDILQAVNAYINKTQYIVDPTNWGVPDYWATPTEFFFKDGDCEDYAISKYVTLHRLGYAKRSMRLVIGQDNNTRVEHAVLAIRTKDGEFILDNQVTKVIEQSRIRHFTPVYAINEFSWWRFAKKLYN